MNQILVHLLGDFVLQSDWMALNKSKRFWPCFVHVCIYTSCFLLLTTSWKALLVIGATHFFLDRYHVIMKRFIWLRGHLNPQFSYPEYAKCDTTGYYDDSPYNTKKFTSGDGSTEMYAKPRIFPVSIWLYIIHDNFLHLVINYFALKYLT